jgi:hypothetical protein
MSVREGLRLMPARLISAAEVPFSFRLNPEYDSPPDCSGGATPVV